jgi:biopolymer transport protein ExbD
MPLKPVQDELPSMNMTPMIDVVFLLIIFFMIITDMTQQELEELELPLAVKAVEDKPNPDETRPIINVLQGGQMIVRRQMLHDPEDPALMTFEPLQGYLVDKVAQMKKAPLSDSNPTLVPEDPVLVRADEYTPFRYVQKIMEICGMTGIQIWKIELAAKTPEN